MDEPGAWYVVRVERESSVWQSAFSHYDDAKAYMDEVWAGYKKAKAIDPELRCHAYIDVERGERPPNGEFERTY
jgi:hypothetical protein